MKEQTNLRNIAIIAHVDHGKTTLVDALLRQSNVFRDNQVMEDCVMDSNDIERERGITIFSKNASIVYEGVKINIIDTPGHADFGGEVERVLNMADGVLLLVDAFEGPMPQTRFVLQKALKAGLKPIVVINKIDRPNERSHEVLDEVFDLFVELDATHGQLDFPHIYASGREGITKYELEDESAGCRPLFDTIIKHIPAPKVDLESSLQIQVASIDYSEYVGRILIGRVYRGKVSERSSVALIKRDGKQINGKVEKLEIFSGLGREQVQTVEAGEIVCITGIPDVEIYDTVCDPENPDPIPAVAIDEPTLTMEFRATTSPFMGQEGKFVTSRHLRDRLIKELRSNVALRVDERPECFHVSGRGLLHLGILIENMRREGFEFSVGRPHVIFKEIDGEKCEPIELLTIDVPESLSGKVMELIGARKGNLRKMETRGERLHMELHIPSRGLIGLRGRMLTATKGEAVMHHVLDGYEPFKGDIPHRANGVMISSSQGQATAYAIDSLQLRGEFFIPPQTKVYEGMIVGENNRSDDLRVNVCKGKKLTNVRSAGSDRNLEIAPPRDFSLEAALEYIEDDELLEITPENIRMRKRILSESEQKRLTRIAKGGN
ncbi:MAG: translational GTPase TypA [Planctomycetes bacterium]|nr:translational GTPase TypA [Planctomycetota bacterium]